jgi:hypothetical protein
MFDTRLRQHESDTIIIALESVWAILYPAGITKVDTRPAEVLTTNDEK